MYTFIDLFSGAGGFLRGFLDAGFKPVLAVENWKPAVETHKANYPKVPIIDKDIRGISDIDLIEYRGKVDAIIGGPPCQGFSTMGKMDKNDPRSTLIFEFIRFVKIIQPKVFIMENVKGIVETGKGNIKDTIIKEFDAIGNNVEYQILCAADYGVPQLRQRIFFIGTRKDLNIRPSFPVPTSTPDNYITVGSAIMDLVGKEGLISNHKPIKHKKIVIERMSYIKEGEGIPKEGLPEHVAHSVRSDFANNKIKNFSHVYKRLSRYRPSNTVVPGHSAFPIHSTENRLLTVREAARLQTFTDDVVFIGRKQDQCTMVGNAVPVKLAYELARHAKDMLDLTSK